MWGGHKRGLLPPLLAGSTHVSPAFSFILTQPINRLLPSALSQWRAGLHRCLLLSSGHGQDGCQESLVNFNTFFFLSLIKVSRPRTDSGRFWLPYNTHTHKIRHKDLTYNLPGQEAVKTAKVNSRSFTLLSASPCQLAIESKRCVSLVQCSRCLCGKICQHTSHITVISDC